MTPTPTGKPSGPPRAPPKARVDATRSAVVWLPCHGGDRNHWDGDHNDRLSGRNSGGLCFISANHFIPVDQPQIVEKLLADFLH